MSSKGSKDITWEYLLKRFYWDILDPDERKYYVYWLISEIPGRFGAWLRGKYVSKKIKSVGKNFQVLAGARFRSMENLAVGDNVQIGNDTFIQALGGVTIGNDVALAAGGKIWSVNHNFKDKTRKIGEQGQTKKEVIIGSDVWLAANVFIMPGVHLPDGMIVAGGSVVLPDTYEPYSIIAGNPAKIVGYRE